MPPDICVGYCRSLRRRWRPGPTRSRGIEPLLVNTVVGFIVLSFSTTETDRPSCSGRSLLRQVAGSADGQSTCARPTMPRPIRTTWTFPGDVARRGGRGVRHRGAGGRDATLGYQSPVVHRRPLRPPGIRAAASSEFEAWLRSLGISDAAGRVLPIRRRRVTAARPDRQARRMTSPAAQEFWASAAIDDAIPHRPRSGRQRAADRPASGVERGPRGRAWRRRHPLDVPEFVAEVAAVGLGEPAGWRARPPVEATTFGAPIWSSAREPGHGAGRSR